MSTETARHTADRWRAAICRSKSWRRSDWEPMSGCGSDIARRAVSPVVRVKSGSWSAPTATSVPGS
ncbi:MAG TPA: hypothetical protein DGB32_02220 [Dehalococcoidia bacterium]|nr:hypothetical protein [Dehalococcoidia bacterium]